MNTGNNLVVSGGTLKILPQAPAAPASRANALGLAAGTKLDLANNKLVISTGQVGTATTPSGNGRLYDGIQGPVQSANLDGAITGDDYSVIDLNILLQGPQIPSGGSASRRCRSRPLAVSPCSPPPPSVSLTVSLFSQPMPLPLPRRERHRCFRGTSARRDRLARRGRPPPDCTRGGSGVALPRCGTSSSSRSR